MDYDRVMVLNAGEIAEYDSPKVLISKEKGIFKSMVEETGKQNAEILKQMTL